MSNSTQPPSYPTIEFLAVNGDLLAIVVAIAPVCVGIWALVAGYAWPWMLLAVGAGAVLWLIVRSYIEVLRILSDTLMPR
jgi:hypothetical protein